LDFVATARVSRCANEFASEFAAHAVTVAAENGLK
jgi:hypothetical protein